MAAHDCVTVDPALERYNRMREDVYKKFRWTRSTTRVAVLSFIAVPGLCMYYCAQQDAKFSWIGKRKGESLAVKKD